MSKIAGSIPWAVAMILIAIGEQYGVVERSTANTMFAILPAMAVVTMNRRRNCLGLLGRTEGPAR